MRIPPYTKAFEKDVLDTVTNCCLQTGVPSENVSIMENLLGMLTITVTDDGIVPQQPGQSITTTMDLMEQKLSSALTPALEQYGYEYSTMHYYGKETHHFVLYYKAEWKALLEKVMSCCEKPPFSSQSISVQWLPDKMTVTINVSFCSNFMDRMKALELELPVAVSKYGTVKKLPSSDQNPNHVFEIIYTKET